MKTNEAIFHHYEEILDELLSNSNFLQAFYQDPMAFEGDTLHYFCDNITIACGVSRSCIIDKDYDYVVKFDILEDEDYGSVCEREVEIFAEAKAQGLDQYFTEARYVGTYTRDFSFYALDDIIREADVCCLETDEDSFDEIFNEIEDELPTPQTIHFSFRLYAYPKAELDRKTPCMSLSDAQSRSLRAMRSPLTGRSLQIGVLFIEEYGFEEYKRISKFAVEQRINDLHFGNIGFINDKIRFIDYGGFHDSCSFDDEFLEDKYVFDF